MKPISVPIHIEESDDHQSDPTIIEYVEEEYIEEMNDEETNDGFEIEEPEIAPPRKRQRIQITKQEDGSFFCELCTETFGKKINKTNCSLKL